MARPGRSAPVKRIWIQMGEIIPSTYVDVNTINLTLDASQSTEVYTPALISKQDLLIQINYAPTRASSW